MSLSQCLAEHSHTAAGSGPSPMLLSLSHSSPGISLLLLPLQCSQIPGEVPRWALTPLARDSSWERKEQKGVSICMGNQVAGKSPDGLELPHR